MPPITGFRIVNNGIGLDDGNYNSFNTAFSPHKLAREGGRASAVSTWLKAFDHARIDSTFKDDDGLHTRSFIFDENYDVDDKRGLPKRATQTQPSTMIELVDLKPRITINAPDRRRCSSRSSSSTSFSSF